MSLKHFSQFRKPLVEIPPLIEIQLSSFEWFLREGLKNLFEEFSPIKDSSEKDLQLEFLDYTIDEPRHSEEYAREHNLSYEAPLRLKVRLTNNRISEVKEQDIFLADMPLMTPRGTFIVNGIERVIVSQLARSFGVYFTSKMLRGKKYFGAKIIPSRGAWFEFETASDGVIYVRIDRKRKFPVTVLLRIFGLTQDSAIQSSFSDLPADALSFIEKTLSADNTKTADEAYVEVYKKIRPGDPATVDNAKSLLQAMFSYERYDISPVGRFKLNQRLKLPKTKNSRIIDVEDLIGILAEIARLNTDPLAIEDDIDHLGNRRIRGIGEMLEKRVRVALSRIRHIIQDRMSTHDIYTVSPTQLINTRPIVAALRDFFTTNQLSQFMDQVNLLAELEHRRRISAMGPGGLTRERAGYGVRDVHPSHYGRICPIETPEGPNIGLIGHLSIWARLNEFGIIETPYRKVSNRKVTDEVVYLTAFEEMRHVIAQGGEAMSEKGYLLSEEVDARVKGKPSVVSVEEVEYIDVSPSQPFSIATNLIPFLEHDDGSRAMMGANMQRQAVPCLMPEAPLVGTGFESRAAWDSGRLIIAEEDGVISELDAVRIEVRSGRKKITYPLTTFTRSNQFTIIHQRPLVNKGDEVVKGQVLADASSSDNGRLALGKNISVAFMSWGGSNFEDAIVISEQLVKDDRFTSIHIENFGIDVHDTKLGPEITTHDIPNVGEEKLRDLDEDGIVRIGAEVRAGDILVGRISPKGESDLTPEERLLKVIFGEKARDVKDTSLKLEHGKRGRVICIRVFTRERGDRLDSGVIKRIEVDVALIRRVSAGDKLAGRHGNKGVISKVLPEEDMPFLKDGTPVEMVLNPLGVVGRMNIGQILETHLGWAAKILGYDAIVPPFQGVSEKEIKEELKSAGLPEDGKVRLYDGRTGESFTNNVAVGYIYMMKLVHMVEDKLHMRSIGPYSLITQQPLGGKAQGGGQRFGEMEVWALEGYGAAHILQEMLTIKSDDVMGRVSAYDAIVRGEPFKTPNIPASFHVLVNELKGLAFNVELRGIVSVDEEDEDDEAPESSSEQKQEQEQQLEVEQPSIEA